MALRPDVTVNLDISQLRSSDPRDYLKAYSKIKYAASQDPANKNEWQQLELSSDRNLFVSQNPAATVQVGRYKDEQNHNFSLIYLVGGNYPDSNSNEISSKVSGLSEEQSAYLFNILRTSALYLSPEDRISYARGLCQRLEEFKLLPYPDMVYRCSYALLRSLQNDPVGATGVEQPPGFIDLIKQKLSKQQYEKIENKINIFHDRLREGGSISTFCSDCLELVIKEKFDYIGDYSSFEKSDTRQIRFPVEQLIRRKVNSPVEVAQILSDIKAEAAPNFTQLQATSTTPEMVDLIKVVGGSGFKDDFVIRDEDNRGVDYVFDYCKSLQTGNIDITKDKPIEVHEKDGKYYCLQDGRHRIMSLKALSVEFVPMVVHHYK